MLHPSDLCLLPCEKYRFKIRTYLTVAIVKRVHLFLRQPMSISRAAEHCRGADWAVVQYYSGWGGDLIRYGSDSVGSRCGRHELNAISYMFFLLEFTFAEPNS